MSKEVQKYVCEFCPIKTKSWFNKRMADKHEEQCFYNPQNKTCLTCKKYLIDDCEDFLDMAHVHYGTLEIAINCEKYSKMEVKCNE